MNDHKRTYQRIFALIGERTPLKNVDCGCLCGGACCKGDENIGMRLFPFEETSLPVKHTKNGRIVICNGSCNRNERPLSCRIFPFFPAIDENDRIYVTVDVRAKRLCPLVEEYRNVVFDKSFIKAVKRVGIILKADEACKAFLKANTEEIKMYKGFLGW